MVTNLRFFGGEAGWVLVSRLLWQCRNGFSSRRSVALYLGLQPEPAGVISLLVGVRGRYDHDALITSFGLINLLALGGVVLIVPHGAFDGALRLSWTGESTCQNDSFHRYICGVGCPCCWIVAGLS